VISSANHAELSLERPTSPLQHRADSLHWLKMAVLCAVARGCGGCAKQHSTVGANSVVQRAVVMSVNVV
jgi:hypothetical protein